MNNGNKIEGPRFDGSQFDGPTIMVSELGNSQPMTPMMSSRMKSDHSPIQVEGQQDLHQ